MLEFKRFLDTKSQLYTGIDRFRAFKLFEKYKQNLDFSQKQTVFHIVGTNGKGSTGRFMTQLLEGLNFKVGHFTSPHIFSFNERFFLNGDVASDELLENAHKELKELMKEDLERLSYFEYSNFLAPFIFKDCDFIVLEAGLGGEYDSTSLFKRDISVFTSISYDHIEILGDNLEDIARTKLKTMAKKAVIYEKQDENVLALAKKIACLKASELIFSSLDTDLKKYVKFYVKEYGLPAFLEKNLSLALEALSFYFSEDELIKAMKELKALKLRARCEKIAKNIYIDVGHNEGAARAMCDFFKGKKLNLVCNFFLDKNIFSILSILKPISAKIMLYDYESERKLASDEVFKIAKELDIACEKFTGIKDDELYLVFGSFLLVEKFLKGDF